MFKFLKFTVLSLAIVISSCSKDDAEKTPSGQTEVSFYAPADNNLKVTYSTEVADTKEKMYNGLMGRTSLDKNSSFLFDIDIVPQDMDVAMWMKDTLIALDMIFVDEENKVFYIHKNAQPNDVTPIYPPKRPRFVLEINSGQAEQYNLQIGDILSVEKK